MYSIDYNSKNVFDYLPTRDGGYVKVILFLDKDAFLLQKNENSDQYLFSVNTNRLKDKKGTIYKYSYCRGTYIKNKFYKESAIFSGEFWQNNCQVFDMQQWLVYMANVLASEEDISYPVNCMVMYGKNSDFKVYVEDDDRVLN